MNPPPPMPSQDGEIEYYSAAGVKITNRNLVVPPNTWPIQQFQPVQPGFSGGKHTIRLVDRNGRQVHQLESDNAERIQQIANAINLALSEAPTPSAVSFQASATPNSVVQPVEVVNFNMPFGALVKLMVKVALASVPATIILVAIAAVVWGVLGGVLLALFSGIR